MSKMYTTGEIAKLCDITVRTVQYYDNRGILTPSEISEGGRRLYSQSDFEKFGNNMRTEKTRTFHKCNFQNFSRGKQCKSNRNFA